VSSYLPVVLACVLLRASISVAQPERRLIEPFEGPLAWEVQWTGKAAGQVEVGAAGLSVQARFEAARERPGHSRLTMTRMFDTPQDFSGFAGLQLRVRTVRPLETSLWLYLIEDSGARYRCDTYAKLRAPGDWQTLQTRFASDFRWDFEGPQDPDQKLDLVRIAGLRLMISVPEGAAGSFVLDDLALYTVPPKPTSNLIWVKWPPGPLRLLRPGTKLPARVSVTVTAGKLDEKVQHPRLAWSARNAWRRRLADGVVDLRRAGEHSAPVQVQFEAAGYAELDLRLLDGERELRRERFCLAALPLPDPQDATPRFDSIFGIWPGGYGTWIKLGAKWARTYCQPWDFEPDNGGYRYIRKDQGGRLVPFAPHLDPELNHICFFRGMPKWLSSRPDRADYKKFPPTDWEAYGRFVTHYVGLMKDRLKVWEVWNEPVPYAYWMGSIEEVVKLHEVTYKAVKRAQPDSIVLGPCPYAMLFDFLEKFFELGGYQWIDAVVVHAYMPAPDPKFIEDLHRLKALMRRYGPEKDIWITEVGWSTRRYTELQQAEYLVQTYVIGLSEGVHTIVWHMNWDYDDKLLRGGHGLLRHTHQPKPGLAAYATLIRQLEGAKFVEELKLPGATARGYAFSKRGRRIIVAWDRGKGSDWQPEFGDFEAYDMMGGPLAPGENGIRLTSSPIYVLSTEL